MKACAILLGIVVILASVLSFQIGISSRVLTSVIQTVSNPVSVESTPNILRSKELNASLGFWGKIFF